MAAFRIPFDLDADVAIAKARALGVIPPAQFYSLPAEKRAQAFTVSGLAKLDQVQAVADALAKMQAEGGTLADFQKWAKTQDWSLPHHRLETIYRNAVQTAYQAGHWRSFEESAKALPYLMYDAINDSRVRPSHLALDGVIKPVDDAFWKTASPPLGHRCRCTLKQLSRAQAMAKGGVTQNVPAEGGADAGWGSDPREWGKTLGRLMRDRLAVCAVQTFANKIKGTPVQCQTAAYNALTAMNAEVPEPTLKSLNFWGQRPGLADLGTVPLVELTGDEFGAGLRYLALAKQADAHLRNLQKESGLINLDAGWLLKINGKSRKKMGDNADQSTAELKAVAGIERLARFSVVAERHADERHHNPDVVAVLRLYVPLLLSGNLYRVRLTVKDYGDPRMLHALSAIEIENAPLGILPSYSSSELPELQKAQPTTGRSVSIKQLLQGATDNRGNPFDL